MQVTNDTAFQEYVKEHFHVNSDKIIARKVDGDKDDSRYEGDSSYFLNDDINDTKTEEVDNTFFNKHLMDDVSEDMSEFWAIRFDDRKSPNATEDERKPPPAICDDTKSPNATEDERQPSHKAEDNRKLSADAEDERKLPAINFDDRKSPHVAEDEREPLHEDEGKLSADAEDDRKLSHKLCPNKADKTDDPNNLD